MYGKSRQRIEQYLAVLRERRFSLVASPKDWSVVTVPERETRPAEGWSPVSFPASFGSDWCDTWFSTTIDVPDKEGMFLSLSLETDAMVLFDSVPFAAVNPFHTLVSLGEVRGKSVKVDVVAWCGHHFPGYHPQEKGRVLTTVSMRKKEYPLLFAAPSLLHKNVESYTLYYDVYALARVADTLDAGSFLYQRIVSSLHQELCRLEIDDDDVAHWEEGARAVRKGIAPLLQAKNGTCVPQIFTSGSAHLDHAWLWTTEETVRKAARTSLNMTRFCQEYPSFRFLFSQPLQMKQVKEKYPTVYRKVREAYERGQWEPNGVGYLEPDCVLSSGEGLIRNLLKGREVVETLFPGYWGDTFFVPDSFGFSGNLPQILRGCGVDYFVTSKLSWNDTNRFPYDTFLWKGIDGSSVKATMIKGAYEGTNDPVQIASMWNQVKDKDVQDSLYRTVGEGDGGGGTTLDDLELMERIGDLQGLPKTSWMTLSQAMKRIFSSVRNLPVYQGELYFELHRGTYTSQGRIKRDYRLLNRLLHQAEYLYVWADAHGQLSPEQRDQASKVLEEGWDTVLLCQFHDILPGSCIGEEYALIGEECADRGKRLENLVQMLLPLGPLLFNSTPYCQKGMEPYSTGMAEEGLVEDGSPHISCPWGDITVSSDGTISSLVFHGREMVAEGKGGWNAFRFGEDYPVNWDAWDLEKDSVDNLKDFPLAMKGFVREGKMGLHSTIRQRMSVHQECCRIDFVTDCDWHESHRLLQAIFPVAIHADDAIFEIPYGYVRRSTKENDSFECAMFEVPAHRYMMVQDQNLAVALLSDSKYGFHAKGGEIGISLLRSPKAPDGTCDMGIHRFVYSVMCTEKGMEDVMAEASLLQEPFLSASHEMKPLCTVKGSDAVVLEWVKPSEDGTCYVCRLRETLGVSARIALSFDPCLDVSSLEECDLLERKKGETSFSFRPFEIKSYRVGRT